MMKKFLKFVVYLLAFIALVVIIGNLTGLLAWVMSWGSSDGAKERKTILTDAYTKVAASREAESK